MGTSTLFLIRHGQIDWNLEERFQGHMDVPLNATVKMQAQQMVIPYRIMRVTLARIFHPNYVDVAVFL